jgi:uncharacterized iron-regulated membrane protein
MRRWLLRIHLIASLLFGLFIVAISTTGSLLVLEEELETLFRPIPYEATAGQSPVETVKQKAVEANPGFQVDRITFPEGDGLYQVRLTQPSNGKTLTKTIYSDPGTGEALGEVKPRSGFYDVTLRLHRYLLLTDLVGRENANRIVGTIGVGFIVVLLTGAFLWWPGLARFVSGFRIIRRKGKLIFNQGLHRSVGVAVLPVLLVLAVTGTAFEFDRYVMNWLGIQRNVPVPAEATKVAAPAAGTAPLPLDQLLLQSSEAHPSAKVVRLTLPQKPAQPLQLALKDGYTPNGNSNTTLYVNPYTGQELYQTDAKAGITVYQAWKSGLHFGRWGGLPVKLLYFVMGMMPFVLMVTGVVIWRLKARVRSRAGKQRQKASAAA